MADTFKKIASVTVGVGGAASMEFTSIPATFTDLILYVSTRSSTTEDSFGIRFNNDSATNYSFKQINGNGSVAASAGGTTSNKILGGRQSESGYTANTFGNNSFYIPNYAGSANKSVSVDGVNENNATTVRTQLTAGLYPQTTAITRIDVIPDAGNFVQYSTATLYGISKS